MTECSWGTVTYILPILPSLGIVAKYHQLKLKLKLEFGSAGSGLCKHL